MRNQNSTFSNLPESLMRLQTSGISMIENPILKGFNPDPSILRVEDDYHQLSFTGAFVGLCCQNLTGQRIHADFASFIYREPA